MPSSTSNKSSGANVDQSALTHEQHHSSETPGNFQSQPPYHEGPYVAGKVSSEERKAFLPAWLGEKSRSFNEAGTNARNPDSPDGTSNTFRYLGAFIGDHLNNKTLAASNGAQTNVEVFAQSIDARDKVNALVFADDAEDETKASGLKP